MTTLQTPLDTLDSFEKFTLDHPDRLFELVNGMIVEKMPTEEHGLIVGNIHALLWQHVKQNKLGRVGVEIRHQTPGDNYNDLLPDVSFSSDTDRPIVTQGGVQGMPDLAVEVKSPNDTYSGLREKAYYYLQNGSKMVWLVYPEKKLVEVFRKDSDSELYTGDESLSGGDVLPDFKLSLSEIFDIA